MRKVSYYVHTTKRLVTVMECRPQCRPRLIRTWTFDGEDDRQRALAQAEYFAAEKNQQLTLPGL